MAMAAIPTLMHTFAGLGDQTTATEVQLAKVVTSVLPPYLFFNWGQITIVFRFTMHI